MNKKTIDKLKLMFMGLAGRFSENRDFFVSMDGSFKSGTKQFPVKCNMFGEVKECFCGGAKIQGTVEDIFDFIAGESVKYEALTLIYAERAESTIISADDRNVTVKRTDRIAENDRLEDTASISVRKYLIDPNGAMPLLKAIGVMGENGKIKNDKIRKYNQIDHFVEIIADLINSLGDNVTIVDCGCGKSYLSFVLNHYLCEVLKKKCRIIGIDIREDVIETCRKTANTLGYRNMEFICSDLNDYKPSGKIDLCISLHACDTATDMALATAVRAGARAIVAVPCCHKELLDKFRFSELEGITKHGILKARISDILTDGLRGLLLEANGYEVTMMEYISPLETPKNLMIKAKKVRDYNPSAEEEYCNLKQKIGASTSMEWLLADEFN